MFDELPSIFNECGTNDIAKDFLNSDEKKWLFIRRKSSDVFGDVPIDKKSVCNRVELITTYFVKFL